MIPPGGACGLSRRNFSKIQWARLRWAHFLFLAYAFFMTTMNPHEHLAALSREASLIGSSAALLGWDQEVLLPEGGRAYRGEQLALLALCHNLSAELNCKLAPFC